MQLALLYEHDICQNNNDMHVWVPSTIVLL